MYLEAPREWTLIKIHCSAELYTLALSSDAKTNVCYRTDRYLDVHCRKYVRGEIKINCNQLFAANQKFAFDLVRMVCFSVAANNSILNLLYQVWNHCQLALG